MGGVSMRYLYVDINIAINRVNYLEGSVADCSYYCNCYDKLTKYKQELQDLSLFGYYTKTYNKEFKLLCQRFDRFMKRHGYFEFIN